MAFGSVWSQNLFSYIISRHLLYRDPSQRSESCPGYDFLTLIFIRLIWIFCFSYIHWFSSNYKLASFMLKIMLICESHGHIMKLALQKIPVIFHHVMNCSAYIVFWPGNFIRGLAELLEWSSLQFTICKWRWETHFLSASFFYFFFFFLINVLLLRFYGLHVLR